MSGLSRSLHPTCSVLSHEARQNEAVPDRGNPEMEEIVLSLEVVTATLLPPEVAFCWLCCTQCCLAVSDITLPHSQPYPSHLQWAKSSHLKEALLLYVYLAHLSWDPGSQDSASPHTNPLLLYAFPPELGPSALAVGYVDCSFGATRRESGSPPLHAVPFFPLLHQRSWGYPCPIKGSGHSLSQLY